MTVYYVSKNGDDRQSGTESQPFLTINHAAQLALPGDTVMVHQGVYREWVDPKNGGLNNYQRIIYCAAANEQVILKGSERVSNWRLIDRGVWKATVPNEIFNGENPFAERLAGDWLEQDNNCHAGDLFVNNHSFYEAHSYGELEDPDERQSVTDYVTGLTIQDPHSYETKYRWFAEVGGQTTTIYGNFHELNPNDELVEISARKCCFYPRRTGINFITISGFEICQAATPWAPPTAEQFGMVGAHWSKGWQIKNNDLHDAKCSAISIGCPELGDDNAYNRRHDKPGYQYQLERVIKAQRQGWTTERIGSHTIRNNQIHDCGQCAIVGNLGGIKSHIIHNHIFDIGMKFEFGGWEIAAIKLHAPIDTDISQNQIDHCILGTWLDWEAQGTLIDRNLYHHNLRDLLIEMSHGPLMVANNIFASKRAIDEYAQGTAFVNNLIAGQNTIQSVLNRATPYHLPHSTLIKGYAMVYGGDDRYYNNIFIKPTGENFATGTATYNGSPTSMSEYIEKVEQRMPGDVELFETVRQPTYINHNIYLGGAQAFSREVHFMKYETDDLNLVIETHNGVTSLSLRMPQQFDNGQGEQITTAQLGLIRLANTRFESPDGKPLTIDVDYFGDRYQSGVAIGPFQALKSGENHFEIWHEE